MSKSSSKLRTVAGAGSDSSLDDVVPPLEKTQSYARREKSGKNHILPKAVSRAEAVREQRKQSRANRARASGKKGDDKSDLKSSRSSKRASVKHLMKRLSVRSSLRAKAGSKGGQPSERDDDTEDDAPGNDFQGRWKSDGTDGFDGFLEELEVSEKYQKLAAKYAGTQVQTLDIQQDGDAFLITSNNDRRTVTINFLMDTPFYSENEKGETTKCCCSWEDGAKGSVLVLRAKNVTSKADPDKEIIVRREVVGRDKIVETLSVVGAKNDKKATRTYRRARA